MSLHDQKAAFDLLGLPITADEPTIRKAWRKLVRTYHPDHARDDPDAANKRLADINAAFDLLSAGYVEERRKARDAAEEAERIRRQKAEAARRARQRAEAKAAAEAAEKARKAREEEAAAEAAEREARIVEDPSNAYGDAFRRSAERRNPANLLPLYTGPEHRTNLRARRAFDAALDSVSERPTPSPYCRHA